jgi:hypothetical protein
MGLMNCELSIEPSFTSNGTDLDCDELSHNCRAIFIIHFWNILLQANHI